MHYQLLVLIDIATSDLNYQFILPLILNGPLSNYVVNCILGRHISLYDIVSMTLEEII